MTAYRPHNLMESETKEAVLGLLKQHNTMSLATSDGHFPYAASLFYASDELVLYFLSKPESRHVINIRLNPGVAVTINRDYEDWRAIKGLQITGKAYEVAPGERGRALEVYEKKYPFLCGLPAQGKNLIGAAGAAFYKVVPERVRLIDNSVHFGYKAEVRL